MKNYLPCAFILALALHAQGKNIPTNASADLVLGQADFNSTNTNFKTLWQINALGLDKPAGVAIDLLSRKVFVSDSVNKRVLRFSSINALTNGVAAEAAFGVANLSNVGASMIQGISIDRYGRLWVANSGANLVEMYTGAVYSGSVTAADKNFGGPGATSATTMNAPQSAVVDANDRLWVADTGNNRVLYFDAISTQPLLPPAGGVIGQPTFAGSLPTVLSAPKGIAVSTTGSLFVSNSVLNTVLRFDTPTPFDVTSDLTLTTSGGLAMNAPSGVCLTADNSLWVTDTGNNRLLRYDVPTSGTFPNFVNVATGVVGQANVTGSAPGNGNKSLNAPTSSPFVDSDGSLWIADNTNNRVLRFPADTVVPVITTPTLASGKPINSKTKIKSLTPVIGTAVELYSIAKVEYTVTHTTGKPPVPVTSVPALATLSGPALATPTITNWQINPVLAGKKGRAHTIKVTATDVNGNVSLVTTFTVKKK